MLSGTYSADIHDDGEGTMPYWMYTDRCPQQALRTPWRYGIFLYRALSFKSLKSLSNNCSKRLTAKDFLLSKLTCSSRQGSRSLYCSRSFYLECSIMDNARRSSCDIPPRLSNIVSKIHICFQPHYVLLTFVENSHCGRRPRISLWD